jgi:hypothetical protein
MAIVRTKIAVGGIAVIVATFVGAIGMYWFDPKAGHQRRSLLRDRTARVIHNASDRVRSGVRRVTRRAKNRVKGKLYETRSHTTSSPADDATLRDRVRSRIGHFTEHPDKLEIEVRDGCVTLEGKATPRSADRLIKRVSSTPGVARVDSRIIIDRSERAPRFVRRIATALKSD